MQKLTTTIQTLMSVHAPGVDYEINLINSQRHIFSAEIHRVGTFQIISYNIGTAISPNWAEPSAKIFLAPHASATGMDSEQLTMIAKMTTVMGWIWSAWVAHNKT